MIRTREDFERAEDTALAPFALRSARSRGRRYPEPEDIHRLAFARDRDRIVHSGAFRRLEYKTQVLRAETGDNYRTRLTHTLEVAQIARSISKTLGLNSELVEALALAHDIGHPPFGHTGEEVLRELMQEHGGFEHNVQALRIVDLIEQPYPGRPGLNLTYESRASILKHGPERAGGLGKEFERKRHPWMEAQLVDLADSLSYHSHDLEDGLRFGVLDREDLQELELWQRAARSAKQKYPEASDRERIRPTIHQTLQLPLLDLVAETSRRLRENAPESPEDIRDAPQRMVSFSPEMEQMQHKLRSYLFRRFYRAESVVKERQQVGGLLRELFCYLLDHPKDMAEWSGRQQTTPAPEAPQRVVCDYVAGMTDRFAEIEYQRLLRP